MNNSAQKYINDDYIEFINQLNYPVLIVDNNYHSLLANKKFLNLHSITSKTINKLKDITINDSIIQKKEYVLEHENKKSIFHMVSSEITLNNKNFYLISLFDVSKSNKIHKNTLLKKKMFERLSEYLPEGIVLSEVDIIYSNPTFERLTGYSGKELALKKFEDLIDEPYKKLFNENLNEILTKTKSYIELELEIITKKNKLVWIRLKTGLIKDAEKTLQLTVVTDISHERAELANLNQLAYYDALTGIYNRRKFDELMYIEYKRSKRYKRNLCGLFFDIDHFKKINDTYGHDIGDVVLQELSSLVQTHVRETDFFARWGGEEFIVLLPETDIDKALKSAENIRHKISTNDFTKVGHITISIGVAQLKGQEQLRTFLKRLDNALYKAKQEGRNRSVSL